MVVAMRKITTKWPLCERSKIPDEPDSVQSSRRSRQWTDPATDGDETIQGFTNIYQLAGSRQKK